MMDKNQQNNDKPLKKYKKQANGYLKYSGMATQMGLIIALFAFVGFKLDAYFDTKVLFVLVGSLSGVGLSLYLFIKQVYNDNL